MDMNLLTRSQFRQHFNNLKQGLGDWDSPLWIPEQVALNKKSRHFISIPPVPEDDYPKFRL